MKKQLLIFMLLLFSTSLLAQEAIDTLTPPVSLGMSTAVKTIVRENPVSIIPIANLTQQLQGRTSGFFATSANGRPGSPAILTIRGQNSIDGDSEPYYIVNGVPTTSVQLSSINIEDIESVTILKDAIATAPYGINGGNGVVVIETKKGKYGAPRIMVSAETGISKILKNKFDLMNTKQKLDYEHELGLIDQATYNARLPYSHNHIDEIFRTAWLQQYNIQVSGRTDYISYFLSGGYYEQDGILENSDFNRYTINANLNIKASRWLKIDAKAYLGKENSTYPLTKETGASANSFRNQVFAALALNPYTQLKNADGSYNKELHVNPLLEASLFKDDFGATNISSNTTFDVTFSSKFRLKSSIILTQHETEENISRRRDDNIMYYYSNDKNSKVTTFIQNNTFSFSSHLDRGGKHWLDISLTEEFNAANGKFVNGSFEFSNLDYSFNQKKNKIKILTGATQLSYSYNDRLFFMGVYRIDKFTKNDEEAKSWALGGKWTIYDRYSSSWLRRISTKVSVGEASHLPLSLTYLDYINPIAATKPSGMIFGSPTWETTLSYNAGIESRLFNNLFFWADLYLKKTSDVLTNILSHNDTYQTSQSEVQNKGIEFYAYWDIISRERYFLNINAYLTLNRNEIKRLPGSYDIMADGGLQILSEGQPLGTYYLARWAGVDAATGQAMWYDRTGSKVTSYYDADKEFIEGKSSVPSKYAGLMISGGYKGFSLMAHFYGTWDIYTFNQNLYYIETSNGVFANSFNSTTRSANYWKKPGDITDLPAQQAGNYREDTRLLQNHSYLRLRSLSLSYDFNRRVLRPLKVIESCRLYVTAHNLFTITGYKGFSPEVLGYEDNAGYPESRTFSWGIKLTFK